MFACDGAKSVPIAVPISCVYRTVSKKKLLLYYYKSNAENIKDDYIGETKCKFGKRIKEHQGSDKEFAIVKNFKRKILIPHQCQNLAF